MNSSRPRLLLVTSRYPFPAMGGDRLRVFHMLRLLSRHFNVELLSLGPEAVEPARITALQQQCGVGQVRVVPQPRWRSLAGAARALFTGEPLQVGYFHNAPFEQAYAEMLPRADVVLMHLIRTSGLWHQQRRIPALLDMVDAISANMDQVVRHGSPWRPWTWVARLEAPRLHRFEREQARHYGAVSFVAAPDQEAVGIGSQQGFVLTMGVDLSSYVFVPPSQRQGNAIALIGKMDTFPNRTAALWAARELMPLLPGMRLKVVGDCSPKLRAQLQAYADVEVTGRVDSIPQACSDCFASIAPLDVATGIQNKALESFALGLPLVLSKSVARGLLPQASDCYTLADNAQQWAQTLQRLFNERAASDAMALRGRRYVEEHHDWDRVGEVLVRHIQALMPAQTAPAATAKTVAA
jgi:glycosyltransferase involved in cell wall biosynthesis